MTECNPAIIAYATGPYLPRQILKKMILKIWRKTRRCFSTNGHEVCPDLPEQTLRKMILTICRRTRRCFSTNRDSTNNNSTNRHDVKLTWNCSTRLLSESDITQSSGGMRSEFRQDRVPVPLGPSSEPPPKPPPASREADLRLWDVYDQRLACEQYEFCLLRKLSWSTEPSQCTRPRQPGWPPICPDIVAMPDKLSAKQPWTLFSSLMGETASLSST